MPPFLESFEYYKEFFIMNVVVLFSRVGNSRVKSDWV